MVFVSTEPFLWELNPFDYFIKLAFSFVGLDKIFKSFSGYPLLEDLVVLKGPSFVFVSMIIIF